VRKLTFLCVPLLVLAAGCGGGGSKAGAGQSHTIVQVSKAFYDQSIPFTQETTFNPYVNGQAVFLPGALNTSDLRNTVLAVLTQSNTANFTGVVAWVFDTDAHASAALKKVTLNKWLSGDPPIVRIHDGNVIIVASGFKGDLKTQLDKALAAVQH
jgi:ABC-type glycerol-3-phosphate transport system substrate-binding protein